MDSVARSSLSGTALRALRGLLAPLLAAVLLGLFVFFVGWQEFFESLAGANMPVYALAFISTCLCLCARSLVWQRMLEIAHRSRSLSFVGSLFLSATFCKYVTPYGQVAAEPGVAAVVARKAEIRYETGLATVVSADFLNYVPYYTIGGLGLGSVLLTATIPGARYSVIFLAIVAFLIVALVGALWRFRTAVSRLVILAMLPIHRVLSAVSTRRAALLSREQLAERLDGFYRTLDLVACDRRGVLLALAYAHLGWVFLALPLVFTAYALGTPLSLGIAFSTVALGKLGSVLPLPGGVGGVEIVIASILTVVATIEPATAAAIAICYRFSVYWFSLFLGGIASIRLSRA